MAQSPQPSACLSELLSHAGFSGAAWKAFTNDPLTGVQVVTEDGQVLYANDQAARMVYVPDAQAADFVGRNAREFLPPAAVEERLAHLRSMPRDGQVCVARSIIHGKQLISTIQAIPAPASVSAGGSVFLILSRHVEGPVSNALADRPGTPVVLSNTVRLGPLDCLSTRELEILAMIGAGMTTPEISKQLFRSVNTINDHRKSIARKLGVSKRARLTELARHAGLMPEDAARVRT